MIIQVAVFTPPHASIGILNIINIFDFYKKF